MEPDRLKRTSLVKLAEQMGDALYAQRGNGLRRSVGIEPTLAWKDPDNHAWEEPYRRGEILVAAVMQTLIFMWRARLEALIQADVLDRDRAAEEGAVAAQHLLQMMIRAIDHTPPVEFEFEDFLSAVLVSDEEVSPDDRHGYRPALKEAFGRYGIEEHRAEAVDLSKAMNRPVYRDFNAGALRSAPDEVARFIWQNAAFLGIDPRFYLNVERRVAIGANRAERVRDRGDRGRLRPRGRRHGSRPHNTRSGKWAGQWLGISRCRDRTLEQWDVSGLRQEVGPPLTLCRRMRTMPGTTLWRKRGHMGERSSKTPLAEAGEWRPGEHDLRQREVDSQRSAIRLQAAVALATVIAVLGALFVAWQTREGVRVAQKGIAQQAEGNRLSVAVAAIGGQFPAQRVAGFSLLQREVQTRITASLESGSQGDKLDALNLYKTALDMLENYLKNPVVSGPTLRRGYGEPQLPSDVIYAGNALKALLGLEREVKLLATESTLPAVDLMDVELYRAKWPYIDLSWLGGHYMPGIDLRGANLSFSRWGSSSLRDAFLQCASLQSADFSSPQGSPADLRGADLRGANLASVNFTNAKLNDARFDGADLRDATFRGAQLEGASFSRANLRGTSFQGAIGLSQAMGPNGMLGLQPGMTGDGGWNLNTCLPNREYWVKSARTHH